jgi:hypothetical protein
MNDVMFWISLVLIVGCLLLCLQKEKRVVPLIRKAAPWGWPVPLVSLALTTAAASLFGVTETIKDLVTLYAAVFASSTVIFFLFRLGR